MNIANESMRAMVKSHDEKIAGLQNELVIAAMVWRLTVKAVDVDPRHAAELEKKLIDAIDAYREGKR